MNKEMKNKRNVIQGVAMATIILALVFAATTPTVSAGTGYEKSMPVEIYPGNMPKMTQWKDTFSSKLYNPFERITTIKLPGIERQWKDTYNGKLGNKPYNPFERITTIKLPGIERQWKDTFSGKPANKPYNPFERITTIKLPGIERQWKDTYNGKSYTPSLPKSPSYTRTPSYSGISSGYRRW